MKFCVPLTIAVFCAAAASGRSQAPANTGEIAKKVTLCELLANPQAYDRQLIEVTGDASHGFEDSGFSSPECDSRYAEIWMAYGGMVTTRTKSTVNEQNPTRQKPFAIDGITVPLMQDAAFKRFDSLLHRDIPGGGSSLVHATVIARFFAKKSDRAMEGYGHLGCCNLFVIQQVLRVYENKVSGLDPSDTPEQPHADTVRDLGFDETMEHSSLLAMQRTAETGDRPYAFSDPMRVAKEAILHYMQSSDPKTLHLSAKSSHRYRIVYTGKIDGKKTSLMVVVSRPAWLSTYAADSKKIAWVVIGAYEIGDE